MEEIPEWQLNLTESHVGKCVCIDGNVCTTGSSDCIGIVKDMSIYIYPRFKVVFTGEHDVSVVHPDGPNVDITVSIGSFLVNHDGNLRVATAEESLTMDVIARARENYTGPPKLIKASIWL